MAIPHHQLSPGAALHPHHRPPLPVHAQPNGHPQSAAQYLARINEATWLQIGRFAEKVNKNETALFAYERALGFNSTSVDALHAIASILRSEDKYDQAVEFIEQILKQEPTNGESWSSLGHCYLMMDELQKAYQAYQSALYNLQDPKEPKLWYGIGILYDRYGSLDHAEEAFSQVMRMAPDFDKANEIYFRLGIIYKQQNKYPESLECFQWIANNPPAPLNRTDILFQIGHVHEQQADFESAKAAYRQVLERDPNHAKVLQQLGWLHHQENGDYQTQEKAIEFLEKSVNSDQNDAQSWYLLGRCYMSQQKFPKAYEAYQQAVYRDGRNPTFWCSIGVLYYQINQYRDALDAYSRAIRLNPNISEVWYDLGTLYQSCNNQTNDALDAYQRAAELDPNNPHIKSRLQLLRSQQAGGSGHQNGVPISQDGHPQTYEPAAVNGPPQPQWAPSLSQAAPISMRNGPPLAGPPNGRDWPQRPGELHGGPPPQQPPMNSYDTYMGRGPPPPGARPHSPRLEQLRHQDPVRHAPAVRPVSPSPRMRNSVPAASYRTSQTGPQHAPPAGPHQQGPPPRMANPNYGGQALPSSSSMAGPPPPQQGALPPYGRPNSPPPQVRPINDGRPRSPRSGSNQRGTPQHTPYQHHGDSAGGIITQGAPAPSAAHAAAEAAARDRDERTPSSSTTSKRHREWEDREESGVYKRNANDESRARLDDPNSARRSSPAAPQPAHEHDRPREYAPMQTNGPPPAAAASNPSSPSAARRVEEQRRADENYRPSEAAHHPQALSSVMHQEQDTLPAIQTSPNASAARSSAPNTASTPVKAEEAPRKDEAEQQPDAPESKDQDGDTQMRVEEPAIRKIDVNEDYDEASDKEPSKAGSQKSAPASGGESRASPKASAPQPEVSDEAAKAAA